MILFPKNSDFFQLTMLTVSIYAVFLLIEIPQFGACTLEAARKDTLQLVQVIFRHGDRAPTYTYPNDPYFNTTAHWPEGLSQLTNRGKMQQYELGQYLRHRYDGFLGEKYSQKELYVTSSDMDRTIMSLESNLAGLFPPVENHWHPNIEWQPIPLRTIPWNVDKYLHNNVKCPRYYELRRELYTSSEAVAKMNEENAEFIRYCAEHSGLPATTVKELYPLLDVLYAQFSHNFSLPEWAQGNTLPKLIELYSIVNTWSTYTTEMKRLWGGPLLNLMIKNMQAITGHLNLGSNPDAAHSVSHGVNRKMLMYSAHDSTLSRLMNTMGVFDPHCPPYAAALLIEMHQDTETKEYYVEIHYRNDTKRAPYLLTPPKCGYPCKLQTLIEISHPLIPIDWVKECEIDSTRPFNSYPLKMHEHDDDFQPDENNIAGGGASGSYEWDYRAQSSSPSSLSCSSSTLQLILMGIGLFVVVLASTVAIIAIIKFLLFGICIRMKSCIVGLFYKLQYKYNPTYYRSAYEQL